MTAETNADAAAAVPDAVVRLLRFLLRPDVTAAPAETGTVVLTTPGKATLSIPLTTIAAAEVAGWIAAGDRTVLKLTRNGREHLRRTRSRQGAPEVAVAPGAAQPGGRAEATQAATIDLTESPLAWLARRQRGTGEALITPAQFQAGERFRADFWFAGLSPRVTSSWSAGPTGSRARKAGARCPLEQTDAMIAARQRIHRALHAVGPELSGILVDVCGHLKGLELAERQARWPKRSAKVVLDLALTALARHYGLIVEAQRNFGPRKVRHWATPGYRPPAETPHEPEAEDGAAA